MDSSFVPSDSDSELPDLDVLLKRPASRISTINHNKTSNVQSSELAENAALSNTSRNASQDEIRSSKKPKQRALKTLEHNSLLLSPVKDVGTPRSKQRRAQKTESHSENLEESFATFMELPDADCGSPRLKSKIKSKRLVVRRKAGRPLSLDEAECNSVTKRNDDGIIEESSSKVLHVPKSQPLVLQAEGNRPTSSYDDQSAFLTYEPRPASPRKAPPISIPGTPTRPILPSPLKSPSKSLSIPPAPFSLLTDDFWSQSAVNHWHEQYSPGKPLTSPRKTRRIINADLESPFSTPTKASKLGSKAKKAAQADKKQFEAQREQLAIDFLAELDATITGGKISEMSQDTGGIKVIWSKKLNSTAGMAHWRRESTTITEMDGTVKKSYRHHASIELATKVIDDEIRLVNTLAHEFCHLANFMISEIKNNPHGKEFKEWAAKCTKAFGNRGVKVTTKHSYVIDYKYAWQCTNCGVEFKRHSKSIDPLKHSCGTCRSKLVQTKPEPRKGGADSEYRAFVKQNFQRIKKEHEKESLGFIMGVVAKQYRQQKQMREETVDLLAEDLAAVTL